MSVVVLSWMLSWWVLSSQSMGSGAHVYLSYHSVLAESDTCGGTFVLLTAPGLQSRVTRNGMKQNRFHPC